MKIIKENNMKSNKNRRREPIKKLGERIKKERKKSNLTQDDIVKNSKNLTNSSLSKIETGRVPDPSISTVRDIAEILKISIDDLVEK